MKWCPCCKKYVETRVGKIENQIIKQRSLIHHCLYCNGFIESNSISLIRRKSKKFRQNK